MTRSKKKEPYIGNLGADSEKLDKSTAHRRLRRVVGQHLRVDPSKDVLPLEKEVSDPWKFDKDGKTRFDPRKRPKWMRK